MINLICKNCGAVNEKDKEVLLASDYNEDDWLCELPSNFEWILPVGKITPVVGAPLYVSSLGGNLTREEYIEKYKIDPEVAYQFMRQDIGGSVSKVMDPENVRSLILGRKT